MPDHLEFITLEISESSAVPKYKQIELSIIKGIETGRIKFGQKLPSINQLSTQYLLSRDTVEKAYNELKRKNIVKSSKGMGFFVANVLPQSQFKVLVLFNKLSAHKKEIYNQMSLELKGKAVIDFFIYHYDFNLFKQILAEHLEGYHYYVIMPHFLEYDSKELLQIIDRIPSDKKIILDHKIQNYSHYKGCIYQDFKEDIFEALQIAHPKISGYNKLVLVFPDSNTYPYPKEIIQGFTKYCMFNQLTYGIKNSLSREHQPEKGVVYVLVSETDLVTLIKASLQNNLVIGKDVGIISYNETILKDVLANGITVMTTDFKNMGKLAAQVILEDRFIEHKNEFELIIRNSL
jgi:DNA-binding transcriptional regulator YhcF (GntR family)